METQMPMQEVLSLSQKTDGIVKGMEMLICMMKPPVL